MKGKYLITTDNWFYGPDGLKYRCAWGEVTILEDSVLGVKTNRNSSNWYAQVGFGERSIIIAGCQIHYAIQCATRPNAGRVKDSSYDSNGLIEFERQSEIYIAE